MTRIDQFESVFKSADKPVFRYEPFSVGSPMVLTDLDDEAAESFAVLSGKYTGAGGSREVSDQRVIRSRKSSFCPNFGFSSRSGTSPPAGT